MKASMDKKRRKMNKIKTEFMLFGNHQQLHKIELKPIQAIEEKVSPSNSVKYLRSILPGFKLIGPESSSFTDELIS